MPTYGVITKMPIGKFRQMYLSTEPANQDIFHYQEIDKFFWDHAALYATPKSNVQYLQSVKELKSEDKIFFYDILHRLRYGEIDPQTKRPYIYSFKEILAATDI